MADATRFDDEDDILGNVWSLVADLLEVAGDEGEIDAGLGGYRRGGLCSSTASVPSASSWSIRISKPATSFRSGARSSRRRTERPPERPRDEHDQAGDHHAAHRHTPPAADPPGYQEHIGEAHHSGEHDPRHRAPPHRGHHRTPFPIHSDRQLPCYMFAASATANTREGHRILHGLSRPSPSERQS